MIQSKDNEKVEKDMASNMLRPKVAGRYNRPIVEELNPFPPSAESIIHDLQVQPASVRIEPEKKEEIEPIILPPPVKQDAKTPQVQVIDRIASTPRSARSVTWEDQPVKETTVSTVTPIRLQAEPKPILHIEVAPDGNISQTRREKPSSRLLARFQRPVTVVEKPAESTLEEQKEDIIDKIKPSIEKLVDKGIEEYFRLVAESPWLQDSVGQKVAKALLGVPYDVVKVNDVCEDYVPYFYKSAYTTTDSFTKLQDNKLELLVELAGVVPELIVYPFGETKVEQIDEFREQRLELDIRDETTTGKASGQLQVRDGVYIITLDNIRDSTGEVVEFKHFSLPLSVSFNGQLTQ